MGVRVVELGHAPVDDLERPEELSQVRELLDRLEVEVRPGVLDGFQEDLAVRLRGRNVSIRQSELSQVGSGKTPTGATPVERHDRRAVVSVSDVHVLRQTVPVHEGSGDPLAERLQPGPLTLENIAQRENVQQGRAFRSLQPRRSLELQDLPSGRSKMC